MNASTWVSGNDLFYAIFTSGSTGQPKGVEITSDCVDNFFGWALSLVEQPLDGEQGIYINQAPFSFDLSVYELMMSLTSGGTLFCLTKDTQESMQILFQELLQSSASVWVSTPSFMEICLTDKKFTSSLLPEMKVFLFCGETLLPETAQKLYERFPAVQVINSYGPTESTVAVTSIVISNKHLTTGNPLPVGIPKPGTRIDILDAQGQTVPACSLGEIVIVGDTVASGYLNNPEQTEKVFGTDETTAINGEKVFVRSYKTGDEGFLDEEGLLHYRGRLDLQIKLNGYRIELGDIEQNIRQLDYVDTTIVLPISKAGKLSYLLALIKLCDQALLEGPSDFELGQKMRNDLKAILPAYMVPRKYRQVAEFPLNSNGKINRSKLLLEFGSNGRR